MLPQLNEPIGALVAGASGGLGLEFTKQLLQSKRVSTVTAACRDPHHSSELVALSERQPDRLRLAELDLCDENSMESLSEQVGQIGSPLHLVLCCSGLLHAEGMEPEKRLSHLQSENVLRSFQVNALGPLLLIKHLLAHVPRRDPSIIACLSARVGSISDNRLGGWYSYRGTKATLNMFLRTLAIELSRSHPGCSCVALHPGTVDTGLSKPFQTRVPSDRLFTTNHSVTKLLEVLSTLERGRTGEFLAWDSSKIPW